MIEYRKGDILAADAEALVNTVNCVGVMGRGVALQFKEAFPENFRAYAAACRRKEVRPGRMFVFETGRLTPPRYIINFPTKRHWRHKSRIEDIEAGLEDLVRQIRKLGICSIALPPLGSGLGGLDWEEVRRRIERSLSDLGEVRVVVFEPRPGAARRPPRRKAVRMTPGRAALVALMKRYLEGALDPFVTLLEVHKLMYFLQEAGEPLKLRFAKGPYGPYAENLRHVLREVEGTFIKGYGGEEESPGMPLEVIPGVEQKAEDVLAKDPGIREKLERVADLVTGFETPSGLELLATVHYLARKEGIRGEDELVQAVHAWGRGKRAFTPAQVHLAAKVLERKGWLPANGGPKSTAAESM
ncbi:MAG: Appr-1-p processing protein [Planctomycetota bacterium]|nr:MAG: Appr-1-p processing protein [Planctomycetota bacterium]